MNKIIRDTFSAGTKRQKGMSHVEIMIAVALVMVVSATAMPNVTRMMGQDKIMDARHQLMTDFNFAQNTAVNSYRRVVVCPSDNQRSCNSSNRWNKGWIVFQDFDANNQRDMGESILRVSQLDAGIEVTSGANHHYRYNPDGKLSGNTSSLLMCMGDKPELGHRVVVFEDGRVRSEDYACS